MIPCAGEMLDFWYAYGIIPGVRSLAASGSYGALSLAMRRNSSW